MIEIGAQKSQSGPIAWPNLHPSFIPQLMVILVPKKIVLRKIYVLVGML